MLHQKRHEPLFHEMLPYHAPPVFPKAPKPQRKRGTSEPGDSTTEDTNDSYRSIYRNWPQQVDDEIDDMFLARPATSKTVCAKPYPNPHVDGALALARNEGDGDDQDEYYIIRANKYPNLHQLNEEQLKSAAEIKHRAAVDAVLSRCPARTYANSTDHVDFIDARARKFVDETNRQTAELLAATRVNTQRESEERDEKQKHIRHRLFLKSNSPFSAAQAVVVSRLEEKLYATSPIDLLIQKNRTRCQYSNLPVVRRLNELAIEEERDRELNRGVVDSSVLAEARRRRRESQSRAAMGDMTKDLQRAIRGKSAHAIGAALYAESMKKIKNSRDTHEAHEECVAKCKSSMRTSRALTQQSRSHQDYQCEEEDQQCMSYAGGRTTHRTIHMELMDDRAIDNMNHNVMNSLEACRYQLKNMSHTSSDMYAASR